MKLTIGMASYNNPEQVWWTIQSLRLYHDLTDCEIIVVDNAGNQGLEDWCKAWGGSLVKYVKYIENRGTAIAKQQVFENASGEFVLCIDSHVMLAPGAIISLKEWINNNRDNADLIHGPMMYDGMNCYIDSMEERWQGNMLGVWSKAKTTLRDEPYEIEMHGMGLFGCFKNRWLGFNQNFVGFGGEEGYIHRKFKLAGKKIICLPFLIWLHRFHDQISSTTYPNILEERIKNYIIGWNELGLDVKEIKDIFTEFEINNLSVIKK